MIDSMRYMFLCTTSKLNSVLYVCVCVCLHLCVCGVFEDNNIDVEVIPVRVLEGSPITIVCACMYT